MYILLINDLTKKFKSFIIWGLILVILFISYMNISIENNKRNLKTYTKSNIQYYEISGRVLYGSFERYQMQTGEIDKNNYDLLVDIVDQQN